MDFAHFQSPKLSPYHPSFNFWHTFIGRIHRENQGQNCGDYPIYLGRSAKSKIPDHLGFSRHMKTRLKLAQVMFVRLMYHLVHSDNLSTNAWISPKEMYLIVGHEGNDEGSDLK